MRAGGTISAHRAETCIHSAVMLPAAGRDALVRVADELAAHLDLMPVPRSEQLWGRTRLSPGDPSGAGRADSLRHLPMALSASPGRCRPRPLESAPTRDRAVR
ncbi:hypothetical protein GCM10009767_20620 [Kocuria aegyptia]|uniref:Uncharacterized protein n=1 Tax=Kocuria aegyptia TaxID=330943 RepID=A0ABP4WS29_9MICC